MNQIHETAIAVDDSPIFGRTFQAVCLLESEERGFDGRPVWACGYRGARIPNELRANDFAVEHEARMAGKDVTVR